MTEAQKPQTTRLETYPHDSLIVLSHVLELLFKKKKNCVVSRPHDAGFAKKALQTWVPRL